MKKTIGIIAALMAAGLLISGIVICVALADREEDPFPNRQHITMVIKDEFGKEWCELTEEETVTAFIELKVTPQAQSGKTSSSATPKASSANHAPTSTRKKRVSLRKPTAGRLPTQSKARTSSWAYPSRRR